MEKKYYPLILLTCLIVVSFGCGLSGQGQSSDDKVATNVARLLTASPVQAGTPLQPATTSTNPLPQPLSPPVTVIPQDTLTATLSTPTETVTPLPTNTPPAEDPRKSLGNPNVMDNFAYDTGWYLYSDDAASFEIKNHHLVMTANANVSNYDLWGMHSPPPLTNFYIEMTGKFDNCEGLDRYGMILRAPDTDRGYLLGISCDGRYSLRNWTGNEFTSLIKWTSSDELHSGTGQENRFGLMAKGKSLQVYLNGSLVAEVEDGAYLSGRFGQFIAAEKSADLKVTVNEVSYWILP